MGFNCWWVCLKHWLFVWTFLDEGSNSSSLIRCPNPGPEQTIIHPVSEDDRVDIPDHFKRFEVKALTLREDDGSSESEDENVARRVSWVVFRICIKNTNVFKVYFLHCSFYISSKCGLHLHFKIGICPLWRCHLSCWKHCWWTVLQTVRCESESDREWHKTG